MLDRAGERKFPATYSTLCGDALASEIAAEYETQPPVRCDLLKRGQNDSYLVRTAGGQYVLRVYRHSWRSAQEVHYELDLLLHLHKNRAPVSAPVRRRDGHWMWQIRAPEGLRPAALFEWAPGKEFPWDDEDYFHYGRALAAIHTASTDFQSPYPKPALDLKGLLDDPVASVAPLLLDRQEDWSYLCRLGERLRRAIGQVDPAELNWGVCHGDSCGNAHITADHRVTFFDFDCCGPGWRVYDVAIFLWWSRLVGRVRSAWPPFIRGYTRGRALSAGELQVLPLLVAMRGLWIMGYHAVNLQVDGTSNMGDRYFHRRLQYLRQWETECMDENPTWLIESLG